MEDDGVIGIYKTMQCNLQKLFLVQRVSEHLITHLVMSTCNWDPPLGNVEIHECASTVEEGLGENKSVEHGW